MKLVILLLIGIAALALDYGLVEMIMDGLKYGFSTTANPNGDNVLGVLLVCGVLIFFIFQIDMILKIIKEK